MPSWDGTKKLIQGTNRKVNSIGMYLLIPMMILTTTDVMARAVWARPITGSIELSENMLAVIILLGLGYTEQEKNNVKVGFIVHRLPVRCQAGIEIITSLLSIFIVSVVVWQGCIIALEDTTVSYMLRIPEAPFRLLVCGGGVLLGLELLINLVDACRRISAQGHPSGP